MARKREFDEEAVLEKAMLLFWKQGYEATSMRALKEATGISSSSMYEAFGDKRSIYLKALTRYCEIERTQTGQMAQESSSIEQFIERLFANAENIKVTASDTSGSMAFNAMVEFGMHDAEVTELLFQHFLDITEIVSSALAKAKASAEITTEENPADLAHIILSTLHGIVILKGMKPDFSLTTIYQNILLKLLKN